jgi:hypothetical protein
VTVCGLPIRSLCPTLVLQMPRFIVLTWGLLVRCGSKSVERGSSSLVSLPDCY